MTDAAKTIRQHRTRYGTAATLAGETASAGQDHVAGVQAAARDGTFSCYLNPEDRPPVDRGPEFLLPPRPSRAVRLVPMKPGRPDDEPGARKGYLKPAMRGCSFVGITTTIPTREDPGHMMRFESLLEAEVLQILLAHPNVSDVIEQARVLEYCDDAGRTRKHTIDAEAHTKDGRRIGIAVRPVRRVDDDLRRTIALLSDQYAHDYAGFVIATEIDTRAKHSAHNARLVRRAEAARVPEHVAAAAEIIGTLAGPTRLADVQAALGLEGLGFPALVACIRDGVARIADDGPLGPDTMIARAETY